MQFFRSISAILLSALLLSACVNVKPDDPVPANAASRPSWLDNPGAGAVGFAGDNVFGAVKQDEAATLRAREEFARRYGVTVESVQNMSTEVHNGQASENLSSNTHQVLNQNNVQCVVKAKWLDPQKNMLWVWVVPAN